MNGYDAWLEAPYQRMYEREAPDWVEGYLGQELEVDGFDAVIEDFEDWTDGDECGKYGGTDLIVKLTGSHGYTARQNMSREEVDAAVRQMFDNPYYD